MTTPKPGSLRAMDTRRRWPGHWPSPSVGPPDPVVVQRIVAGQRPRRWTLVEMHAAVQRLTELGLSAAAIADRVGCSERTVNRYRGRRGDWLLARANARLDDTWWEDP